MVTILSKWPKFGQGIHTSFVSMGRTLELSHVSNKKVYVTCFGLRLVANVLGPGKQ